MAIDRTEASTIAQTALSKKNQDELERISSSIEIAATEGLLSLSVPLNKIENLAALVTSLTNLNFTAVTTDTHLEISWN